MPYKHVLFSHEKSIWPCSTVVYFDIYCTMSATDQNACLVFHGFPLVGNLAVLLKIDHAAAPSLLHYRDGERGKVVNFIINSASQRVKIWRIACNQAVSRQDTGRKKPATNFPTNFSSKIAFYPKRANLNPHKAWSLLHKTFSVWWAITRKSRLTVPPSLRSNFMSTLRIDQER